MKAGIREARELHEDTPPNWYFESLKVDFFQRLWHKSRFDNVAKVIEKVDGKVLDIGSADGVFSKVILDKTNAEKLIGIEVLKTSVNWAKKHWKNSRMKFFVGDAHKLEFPANTFDVVFTMEVLEHVANPKIVLREVKRVLKRGGYGVFLVPSDSFLFRSIWYLWLHFYPRGWVWNHTHIQTYRKNYLTKICRQTGFNIEVDKKFNLGMLHLVKVRKISI
jgi:2-polyprenyl-3-methyl-5-hydroxy-6-metoxy-1,4-benzoquinol methylase